MILLKRGLLTQAPPPPPPPPALPPPPPPPAPPPLGKHLTLSTHAERSTPLNLRKPLDLSIGHVTFLLLLHLLFLPLILPHLLLFAWFLDSRQEAACRNRRRRHRRAPPPEACCSHNTAVLWKNREQTKLTALSLRLFRYRF